MHKSDNQVLKCTYCQQSLGNISVICAKCVDFNLCLKCFSMSAEIGEHKKEHDYRIRALNSPFPIFDSDKLWSFKEENFLLAYIEQYGFGNWDEIAKNFETRSAQECMQHYFAYYIYGNIGKYSLNNGKPLQDSYNIDHTKDSDITVLLPPIEMSVEEQRALGYMPLRDDFEREFKNDAETLLSNLTINNDDDEADVEAKITLAKMYREILLDRQRLKKIAREYGLINNASALINKHRVAHGLEPINKKDAVNEQAVNKKRRREEETSGFTSDLNDRFKKFAQLCNASIYENLIDNMRKRNQLISRIEELNKYRENGIRTFKEIDVYKEAKLKRESEKQLEKTRKSTQLRRSPTTTLHSSPLKKTQKLDGLSTYRSTNDLIDDHHNNTTNLSCASSTSSNGSHDSNSVITNVSNYSSSIGSLDHNNIINRNGRSERLCSMPGYNMLSENEKKLITTLKMKPTLYITFKTFLIKNNISRKRQLRASTILSDKSLQQSSLDDSNTASSPPSPNNNNSMSLRKQQTNNKVTKLKRLNNSINNNKLLNSFPNYGQIPRTTRKRIFRFLCDNGWIDGF